MGLSLRQLGAHGPVYGPAGVGNGLPAVVILHGAEGPMAGWSHRFAAILAGHGMLALPHAYGAGDFFAAGAIRDVDLSRVVAAGEALAAEPRAGRVGLLGWSRGGEAALLVASLGAGPFAAVAAHAAPDRVLAAFDPAAMRAGRGFLDDDPGAARSWRWPGVDLVPGMPIAVERIAVPLLLSAGTADEVWPSAGMARGMAARVPGAELMLAEGQGHGFDFDTEPALWARLVAFFGRHLGTGDGG